ncbi:MAG: sugar phosphate isomerase/epimerase [Clostridia bacterium]|nr:sugar phosphate isomerase/epimerase [Clostridia bacterium]
MELGAFYSQLLAAEQEHGIKYDDAMAHAQKIGITAMDVNVDFLYETEPEVFAENLKKYGMHVSSVHSAATCEVTPDGDITAGLERMKEDIRRAKRVGSPFFMAVPQKPATAKPEEKELYTKGFRKLFSELAKYGKEIGVQVTVEDFSTTEVPYASFEDLDWLLDNIPELMFTFDTGNFSLAGFDEIKALDRYTKRTVYLHMKGILAVDYETDILRDGVYYEIMDVGSGTVDNKKIFDHFMSVGYDGVIILECNFADQYNRTLKSVDFMNEIRK